MRSASTDATLEQPQVSALQLQLRLHAMLTRAVASGADNLEMLLQPCVQALATALGAEALGLWTLADGGELVLRASVREDGGTHPLPRVLLGRAHASALLSAVQPALFHDPRFEEPLFSPPLSGPQRHVMLAPLVSGEALAGVVALARTGRPTPHDDEAFRSVADLLTIAVDRQRAAELLREREDGLGTLIATAPDGIVVIDGHGSIIAVNPSLERIFGYQTGELQGENVTLLMPERFRSRHNSGIRRYRETGQKRISWHGIELVGLHKDGSEFPIEISFGEYARNGQTIFTGFIRDITERRRNEERERRRRRAVQSTAVYVGSALVTLQAADLILPALPLPAWSFNALVLLAIAGLPLVLGVAWGWGVRSGTRTGSASTSPAPMSRRTRLAAAALIPFALGAGALQWVDRDDSQSPTTVLAVLPFTALDDTPLTVQFAGGLTHDMVTAIAAMDGLRVVSHTSVLAQAAPGRTMAQIGRELGASFLVEGSVRRVGDRSRVSVRLARAGSDRHVWAGSFDRQLDDPLAVQEELAGLVAAELARRLGQPP